MVYLWSTTLLKEQGFRLVASKGTAQKELKHRLGRWMWWWWWGGIPSLVCCCCCNCSLQILKVRLNGWMGCVSVNSDGGTGEKVRELAELLPIIHPGPPRISTTKFRVISSLRVDKLIMPLFSPDASRATIRHQQECKTGHAWPTDHIWQCRQTLSPLRPSSCGSFPALHDDIPTFNIFSKAGSGPWPRERLQKR